MCRIGQNQRGLETAIREGALKLLAIKDSDIEILTLLQAGNAVDEGLHACGAFLAIVPKSIGYLPRISSRRPPPPTPTLDQ